MGGTQPALAIEAEAAPVIPRGHIDVDHVRVPSAEETAATIARARAALATTERRQAYDDARTAEDARAEQLAHWRDYDLTASPYPTADLTLDGVAR